MGLKQLQATWNTFGERDPLWAILTAPGKESGGWEIEEFFQTGQQEIARVMEYVDRLHPVARKRALDFGCGVGRLTQALAEHFEEVAGVDIAPSMLELARRYNRHGERCSYHLNTAPNLAQFATGSFDFIYSNITLQHIDPPYIKSYLREFGRILAPGGVLLFQLPEERTQAFYRIVNRIVPAFLLRFYRACYIRWRFSDQPVMEMHALRRPVVVKLLQQAGMRMLEIVPDTNAGGAWASYTYCATKPGRVVP